jgi:coenzyme Q-binding protein COQ10
MPKYKETITTNFSQKQIYDLIASVDKYPEFLPWCSGVRITAREENKFTAELLVKFKSFRESYTSEVTLTPSNMITIRMIEGPFKYLHTSWHFKAINNQSSEINFDIDFAFNSLILEGLIGLLFDKAVKEMTKAFIERAKSIYS